MIRRGDDYSLNIFPLEHASVILVDLRLTSGQLPRTFRIRLEDIANGEDHRFRIALEVDQVHLPHAAAADQSNTNPLPGYCLL